MLTTAPRGTKDIMPADVKAWRYLEETMRKICAQYGYKEIRTPVFEHTELFLRGIGETTDVVEKEMYTFNDRGNRSITLRPENTASAVRAYIEHKLYAEPAPTKLFYIGPMFRYDRPQAGRYRQFHQFGIEALGVQGPNIDAEIILLAVQILQSLGLKDLKLKTNIPNLISCPTCGRIQYNMIPIAREIEEYLSHINKNITVAVMGCAVNGPGEAKEADLGIAGGVGEALLFKKGQIIRKIKEKDIICELKKEIDKL